MSVHPELGTVFIAVLALWASRATYYRGKRLLHTPTAAGCDCSTCKNWRL